jgi:hypothetical protein
MGAARRERGQDEGQRGQVEGARPECAEASRVEQQHPEAGSDGHAGRFREVWKARKREGSDGEDEPARYEVRDQRPAW